MIPFISALSTITAHFNSDPENGLSDSQVPLNRARFGINSFTRTPPTPLWKRIWEAFCEPMIILLVIAGLIATGVNLVRFLSGGHFDVFECVGIFCAIFIAVSITLFMEGRSAKAFEALSKINADILVRVIRNGAVVMIRQNEVVAGDIVLLATGDKIVADGRLIESVELHVDESSLTGESVPATKDASAEQLATDTPIAEQENMVFSGCYVTSGHGKMIVTAVGDSTEFGKIAHELADVETGSTPLQEKLTVLGKRITILGSVIAAIVFLVQVVIFIHNGTATFETISEAFITSIVLIVASVPEGLPTIVAVSLSINIIKMSKQNALVKKMVACETVGCIGVICSDKTGTLTENRMTVTHVHLGDKAVSPHEITSELLLKNFALNSTADVNFLTSGPAFIGNPTECALLVAAHKAATDYRALRAQANIVQVYPFSSDTKNMTTVAAHDAHANIAYTKGSPEKILALCDLTPEQKKAFEEAIENFQKKACRVIGFAHKIFDKASPADDRAFVESHMTFDGFVAITDPLRSDVYAAMAHCRSAGIDLKILTGDNIITATAIANELKILDAHHLAVEAKDLMPLSDEAFSRQLPSIRVIARSTPIIKMRVVKALKAMGHVVAVTGDGINDAPAIKHADVGVAMGITGTEVSKEASDIVLLDDSFSTIVNAIKWGRGIYENFRRFIQFQLTVNFSSVVVVLVSVLMGFKSPFTALQLLWINIVMDGPPALTLGLEPIRDDLMTRKPTRRDESIISTSMLWRIAINGLFMAIALLGQQSLNFLNATSEQMTSVLFTLFVIFQLFNAFNCRELTHRSILRNLISNRLMLAVFGVTFLLQVVITQYGGAFFNTTPLPLDLWLKILAVGACIVVISELTKIPLRFLKHETH